MLPYIQNWILFQCISVEIGADDGPKRIGDGVKLKTEAKKWSLKNGQHRWHHGDFNDNLIASPSVGEHAIKANDKAPITEGFFVNKLRLLRNALVCWGKLRLRLDGNDAGTICDGSVLVSIITCFFVAVIIVRFLSAAGDSTKNMVWYDFFKHWLLNSEFGHFCFIFFYLEMYINISILIQNVNILTATARKGPAISNVSDRKRFDTDITSLSKEAAAWLVKAGKDWVGLTSLDIFLVFNAFFFIL